MAEPVLAIFLVWDRSREEHGEGPELCAAYLSRESAQDYVDRQYCDDDHPPYSIEEREVME